MIEKIIRCTKCAENIPFEYDASEHEGVYGWMVPVDCDACGARWNFRPAEAGGNVVLLVPRT